MSVCGLCRRSLLVGEEFRSWRLEGRTRVLCRLCEPLATEHGWVLETAGYQRESVLGLTSTVRLVDPAAARAPSPR